MTYRIKGWGKFQHFKDRRPPWVKLYRDILDDPDWHDLDGDTAKVLIQLWLIASEDETQNGCLPDTRRLSFRLRITEAKAKQALTKLSHWLIYDDIATISPRYRSDAPETETETEKEKETEAENTTRKQVALVVPDDVSPEVWQDFLLARKAAKAPVTDRVVESIRKEASGAGWTLDQAMREMVARGWRGFKAEWVRGIKADWKNAQAGQKPASQITTAFSTMGNFGKPKLQGERHVIDITPSTRLLGQ
jgi:hypothetical protein